MMYIKLLNGDARQTKFTLYKYKHTKSTFSFPLSVCWKLLSTDAVIYRIDYKLTKKLLANIVRIWEDFSMIIQF